MTWVELWTPISSEQDGIEDRVPGIEENRTIHVLLLGPGCLPIPTACLFSSQKIIDFVHVEFLTSPGTCGNLLNLCEVVNGYVCLCNFYWDPKAGKIEVNCPYVLSRWVVGWGFPGSSVVKNPPAKQETRICSLGKEDPLKKEMATSPSILTWKEEPGGLQSMGSQRVRHNLATKQQQLLRECKPIAARSSERWTNQILRPQTHHQANHLQEQPRMSASSSTGDFFFFKKVISLNGG